MNPLSAHTARVRQVIAIEEIVGQYVSLRRFGNHYKGLCPFHKEKTPSFTVNPDRGFFHCFGCQTGGDAITFLQKVENYDFMEALRVLSERAGLPMPEMERGRGTPGQEDRHKSLLTVAAWAAGEYRRHLQDALQDPSDPITGYLNRRGIDGTLCSRFGLGLAPDSWDWLFRRATQSGTDPELLVAAGILGRAADPPHRIYDRFRGRLIFPISDLQGRVVALAGRVYLPDAKSTEAKYINSPECEIYHKGDTLYAMADSRAEMSRSGRALLMEGYLDVMRAHQHGFAYAVATCGTAMTERQARTLKRFAREVFFAFDGDEAGQQAMLRSSALLLAEGLELRVIALPPEDDPDTFLRREGAAPFQQLLDSAPTWLEHFLRTGLLKHGSSIEGRTRIADQILPLVARMPHPIARDACMQRVASVLQVSTQAVGESVQGQLNQLRLRNSEPAQAIPASSAASGAAPTPQVIRRADQGLVRLLVESIRARRAILPALTREGLHHPLPVAPIIDLLLQTEDIAIPDYHTLADQLDEADPLRSALASMATDSEPLDDGDRTIEIVLARLRREKSLRRLRQLHSTDSLTAPDDPDDMPPEEPHGEVSEGDWDSLPTSNPIPPEQQDLFRLLNDTHQVAIEAVEHSRILFQGPGSTASGRGKRQ